MTAEKDASKPSGAPKRVPKFTWSEGHHVGRGANDRGIDRSGLALLAGHGIGAVGLARWTSSCWSYSRNHQWGHVVVTVAGRGRWWFDGQWHEAEPETVFISRPGVEFGARGVSGHSWELAAVLYAPDAERSFLASLPRPVLQPAETAGLYRAVDGLFSELGGASHEPVLRCLVALIDAEARRLIDQPAKPARLAALWQAVGDDISRPWSVDQMAGLMRISEQHLRRICREETTMSPQQYLAHLRMTRAAQLLLAGKHSVDSIARLVGYDSQFSLSKAFKRHHGIGPRGYRKQRGSS